MRVRVYARGLHGDVVFTYDIPSHRLAHKIVDALDDVFHEVDGPIEYMCSTAEVQLCDENEDFCDRWHEERRRRLIALQDAIFNRMRAVLERMAESAPRGVTVDYYGTCTEPECCHVIVYIMIGDPVHDVLIIDYWISFIEDYCWLALDRHVRTAICTLVPPVPHDVLSKHLLRLEIPDNREITYDIELGE